MDQRLKNDRRAKPHDMTTKTKTRATLDNSFVLTPEATEVLSQGFTHPIFQTYKPLRVLHAIGIFAIIKQLHQEGRQVSRSVLRDHCRVAYAGIDPYVRILEELKLIEQLPDPIPQRRTKILVPLTVKKPKRATVPKTRKPKAKPSTPKVR